MTRSIVLQDAFKGFTLDQDKIFSPQETVKRLKEKLATLDLDILERTTRIDNGRLGIPVFFSKCGKDARKATGTAKQMGKGGTVAQAEASAVMELAERFSFFSFAKNPANFSIAKYNQVEGPKISFEQIALSVHDDSDELDITRGIFEELPLKWTSAFNLSTGQKTAVPFDWFFAINEFNGPSAGNCPEEALSQGICEIVERHVSSIISRGRISVPAIDPDSTTDALVVDMIDKYRRAGINVYLSDFTLEMGIPSVGILAWDPSTFPSESEIVWTAGTTTDPQKALSRALTEVAQLAGDFNSGTNYVASGLPKFTHPDEAAFIINPPKTVPITSLPDLSHENIRVEVENCLAALSKRGLEVIVVDTMHAGLQVPAFYTIVPGAHFRERAVGTSVGMFAAKLIYTKNSPEGAVKKLAEVAGKLPGKYYVQFYLGSAHLDRGDPELALSYFRKAIDLNPVDQDIPSIYSYMGVCLKDLGKYTEALSVLRKGEQLDKERTDIYNLMGFCHFMQKEHAEAIRCFKRVLELNPSSAIDYANIASNYRDMGRRQKAIDYYEMALAIDPTNDLARDNLEKLMSKYC